MHALILIDTYDGPGVAFYVYDLTLYQNVITIN